MEIIQFNICFFGTYKTSIISKNRFSIAFVICLFSFLLLLFSLISFNCYNKQNQSFLLFHNAYTIDRLKMSKELVVSVNRLCEKNYLHFMSIFILLLRIPGSLLVVIWCKDEARQYSTNTDKIYPFVIYFYVSLQKNPQTHKPQRNLSKKIRKNHHHHQHR